MRQHKLRLELFSPYDRERFDEYLIFSCHIGDITNLSDRLVLLSLMLMLILSLIHIDVVAS